MQEHRHEDTNRREEEQKTKQANLDGASLGAGAHNHRPRTHQPALHMRGLSHRDLTVPILTHLTSPHDSYVIPSRIRGIILDFDGTTMKLNYTEGMRQKAYRKAIQSVAVEVLGRTLGRSEMLECHNPAISKPEQEMAEIIGARLSAITGRRICGSEIFGRWLEQCEALRERSHQRYGRHPHSAIIHGIRDLLDSARERGIPVSICTAGAHQFVEPLLQVAGLKDALHSAGNVFTNRHPEIRTKPHADPYLLVCKKLGLEPSQILVAEDSATGALAALRAGARVIFQPSGNREQTLRSLVWQVKREHPEWIDERPGAVTVLCQDKGWSQVKFPSTSDN